MAGGRSAHWPAGAERARAAIRAARPDATLGRRTLRTLRARIRHRRMTSQVAIRAAAQLAKPASSGDGSCFQAALHTPQEPESHSACAQRRKRCHEAAAKARISGRARHRLSAHGARHGLRAAHRVYGCHRRRSMVKILTSQAAQPARQPPFQPRLKALGCSTVSREEPQPLGCQRETGQSR